MSDMTGSCTQEIDAPVERVWAVVADVERSPEWQGGVKAINPIDRDEEGRPTRVNAEADIKVRVIKTIVKFDYSAAPNQLAWTQEKGDIEAVDGTWTLEDLGGDRTRATYALDVTFGGMLGALVKGPVELAVRGMLISTQADDLKRRVEEQ
jgi:ribosome-associated toxin RatA of RatAB toxin-antitoxin module